MKKYLFAILVLTLPFVGFCQKSDDSDDIKFDKEKFLKELSENACKCIDSINTGSKNKKEISTEIHSCIDEQTTAYQLGLKISGIKKTDDKKEITIEINSNPDSDEYKKYYYEIERYLTANCTAVKNKMAVNDVENEKSVSRNPEALKYYSLGLKESEKENYAKAIQYFKKAVVFDTEFAFAYDNIGVCSRKLNLYDEAIDAYEKSLKIDPNGTMPLQNIAIVYVYKQEYKKAVKAYERLAKVEPNNPEVFFGIGNIYAQALFDYEKALENLCQAYTLYLEQKSPYRTDAEKLIQIVYNEMKKQGKEATFNEILTKHHISPN